jgi:hypothetical protein
MFEKAEEDPFYSINRENGMTVDTFLSLLEEIDGFVQELEKDCMKLLILNARLLRHI